MTKGTVPPLLAENASAWTQVLLDREATGEPASDLEKTRYNHRDVKEALIDETHGKCAYCESKLRHITYGDIEHIVPKSSDIRLTFEWTNLTLACDVCNTCKGTKRGLFDPYMTDPQSAFTFRGPMILPVPGNNTALITEIALQLNRDGLLDRRAERLRALCKHLHLIVQATDPITKAALLDDILLEVGPDREFSAFANSYISEELARLE